MTATKHAKTLQFDFYSDPGHGWMAVPRALLAELGIVNQITRFSYYRRDLDLVYLEEDCDLSTFLRAAESENWALGVNERHTESESFIRNLPAFDPEV